MTHYVISIILCFTMLNQNSKTKTAYFGGGCFWCIEAIFENINGVISVKSGYSGGLQETANYKDVCSGKTKHAEICQIQYDPKKISYDILLEIFFLAHDPTTLNRQGNDIGPQYRSIIFFSSQEESNKAKEYIDLLEKNNIYTNIQTEVAPLIKFYIAEDNHQNYFNLNPNQAYCSLVINPKIQKLRKQLKNYYKN